MWNGDGANSAATANGQDQQLRKNGTPLTDKELFGGETNWLRKMGVSDYAVPNTTGDTGTWGQSVDQWREDNPTYMRRVEVQGQSWSAEQKLASWFPGSDSMSLNSTEQSRNFNQRYYNSQEASASNPVSAAFWHVAGLTSDAAHNLESAGRGVAALLTDGQAQTAALNGLQQTWNHLPSVVIKGMQDFSQMSYGEQAGSLYKFGLENVATFGAGKIAGAAGGFAYQGGVNTLKWLAPTIGDMAFTYAQRTGMLLTAVEDTGVSATASTNSPLDISSLTPKDIPTFRSGQFNEWFDARSPNEIASIYESPALRNKTEAGLRGLGGNHEYLMVAEAPQWSKWGVSAQMVQEDFAVSISSLNEGGLANGWTHSTGIAGSTSPGSKMVHNQLQQIIQNSSSLPEFRTNIAPWAEQWITGGYKALPPGFHY